MYSLAIVITGITGVILGTPTLRVRGDYLAIVTLGFGEIVRLLADNLKEVTNGPGSAEVLFPELGSSADNPDGVFSVQNNAPSTPVSGGTGWHCCWWSSCCCSSATSNAVASAVLDRHP